MENHDKQSLVIKVQLKTEDKINITWIMIARKTCAKEENPGNSRVLR